MTLNRIYSEVARANERTYSGMYSRLAQANAGSPVSVDIQAIYPMGSQYSRVSATINKPCTVEEIATSISTMLERKVRLVPGSVKVVDERSLPAIVSFVVAKNKVSQPFTNDGFREVSSTVAIDTQDRIWRIEGEGENRRLIQETQDDLDQLLQARRNRQMVHTAAANLNAIDAQSGDFVCYLDTAAGQVSYGALYNTQSGLQVVDIDTLRPQPVQKGQILEAAREEGPRHLEFVGLEPCQVLAKLAQTDVDKILTYLAKIWPGPMGQQMIARYRAAIKMS